MQGICSRCGEDEDGLDEWNICANCNTEMGVDDMLLGMDNEGELCFSTDNDACANFG